MLLIAGAAVVVNAAAAALVLFYPLIGTTVVGLPLVVDALKALIYIFHPTTVYLDPRGREYDLTRRKIAVVITLYDHIIHNELIERSLLTLSQQISPVVDLKVFIKCNPLSRLGAMLWEVNDATVDSFRSTPECTTFSGFIGNCNALWTSDDMTLDHLIGRSGCDFVLHTTPGITFPPGSLHRMSNIMMANRGFAAVVAYDLWEWRPYCRLCRGRVATMPAEGTMINIKHPSTRGCKLKKAHEILEYSDHTLIGADYKSFLEWVTPPPFNYYDKLVVLTAPARMFMLINTFATGELLILLTVLAPPFVAGWIHSGFSPWSLPMNVTSTLLHAVETIKFLNKTPTKYGQTNHIEDDYATGCARHGHEYDF